MYLTSLFTGLCADCSDKLNYKHKKREIKRNKKRKHRPEAVADDDNDSVAQPEILSPDHPLENVKQEETNALEDETVSSATETEPVHAEDEDNIWKTANRATEEKSREEDFEEFLEQLLL